ncbi:MAG: hypothetical protein IKH39_05415 [Candidatus Methanomethylophilaceae archaeon]|nr:hypothetical protein [Candidatus Methanomethylophilaceae archaeon]
MVRPREGDEIKRTIVKRGDRFYAYEVTSTMENGKKKTVSTYLGRVDPDTKELLPKIPEKSAENRRKIAKEKEIAILKGVSSKEYGATYLLHEVQLRMSLGGGSHEGIRQFGEDCTGCGYSVSDGTGCFQFHRFNPRENVHPRIL